MSTKLAVRERGPQTLAESILSDHDPRPAKSRGANHHDKAVAFSEAFPVGSTLTPSRFDEWAQAMGYLEVPTTEGPDGVSKRSDVWLAHLQRRHQLHYNINRAATHIRMSESNRPPFRIDYVGNKLWEVRSPHEAMLRSQTARKYQNLGEREYKGFLHLIESGDFLLLSKPLRYQLADLAIQIDTTIKRADFEADVLQRSIDRVRARVLEEVNSGQVTPVNGGIAALLANNPDEDDDEQ